MEVEKVYTINQSLEGVRTTFKDLKLYGSIHPLIRKVELVETTKNGNLYKIIEQPYPYLPFRITYEAMVAVGQHEIKYTIAGIPWTEAQIKYFFKTNAMNNKVDITFQLQIKGKLLSLGQRTLQKKMLKAQDQLMAAMAAL